jgi:hypothetical protein
MMLAVSSELEHHPSRMSGQVSDSTALEARAEAGPLR